MLFSPLIRITFDKIIETNIESSSPRNQFEKYSDYTSRINSVQL